MALLKNNKCLVSFLVDFDWFFMKMFIHGLVLVFIHYMCTMCHWTVA